MYLTDVWNHLLYLKDTSDKIMHLKDVWDDLLHLKDTVSKGFFLRLVKLSKVEKNNFF